jgi:uncharacterized protein (DUF3084 family)
MIMPKSGTERRLSDVATRLKARREELGVIDEQLAHFEEEADDARIRALVSDGPLADREGVEAERHAQAMRRHRAEVVEELANLERQQDELLDRMMAEKAH